MTTGSLMKRWAGATACAVAMIAQFAVSPLAAQQAAVVELKTNESMIEDLRRSAKVEISDAKTAFAMVFAKLPDEVFVHPTENYYYYSFSAGGLVYAGNLRLAARDRDNGVIHFAIFRQGNVVSAPGEILYEVLGKPQGVSVTKLSDLRYEVRHAGKSVIFQLNDVSGVEPPKSIVADGEEYLGLVADESGLRFYLFYNRRLKLFSYVLDESGDVLDTFEPLQEGSRILIGHRTGFAVYRHHHLDRKVLIGVHDANTFANNYFDGPADQLPENHIKNDNLLKAIVDANPDMAGKLDEFGYLNTGEGRYLIAPYVQYQSEEELVGYDACASDPAVGKEQYDGCFHAGDE